MSRRSTRAWEATYRDITPEGKVRFKADMLNAVGHLKTKATGSAAKVAAEFRAAHRRSRRW